MTHDSERAIVSHESEPALVPTQLGASWFASPIARKLLARGLVAVIAAGIGAIPYPLYVTEECLAIPIERRDARAQVDGVIADILVDEGASVHKDDVIARLDTRDVDGALAQAEADVERCTANLEKLRAGNRKEEVQRLQALVTERRHEVQFAELALSRRRKAFTEGVGTAEQRDNAEHDVAIRRAALAQAEADLRLGRAGSRAEEVAIGEAELKKATADVEYLRKRQALHTIVAPVDGQVTTPRLRERLHEKVAAGGTVSEIADVSSVRFDIFVPERHRDIVKIGQPTVVKIQAYPLNPFNGRVVFIAPATERQQRNGETVVRVQTVIENPDGLIHEGLTGYGEINTGRRSLASLALRRVVRWIRVRFLV